MSSPEQELKMLLHYGREVPFYQPGDRLHNEFYHSCIRLTIKDLIASEKLPNAVNCIVKAFTDGYSAHPSMLVYALAVCAKQNLNENLREAAYKAVKTVCSTPENFFLFINFAIKLSEKKSCWGSGCRKVLKTWYLSKDIETLSQIVGRNKGLYGWSHKDIIKLIHLKTDEPGRAAVVKYLLFGIQEAKTQYGENPEAFEVLNYLQAVEDLKHITDEQQAARFIENHKFTLEHVPPHLVKFKEVWCALTDTMSVSALIKNIERLGYLGLLKPNSILVDKICFKLELLSLAESHIHPAQVYNILRSYETSSKFLAAENAKKKRRTLEGSEDTTKKGGKAPPKANLKIVSALNDLFTKLCKLNLSPTGLRYFVGIDLKSLSHTDKCFRCSHVSPAQATVLITTCLLYPERNVTVKVAGTNDTLLSPGLTNTMTIQQGVKKLEESAMHRMKLSAPIEHALKKKEEYDVFLMITDTAHKGHNAALTALEKYRAELNIPNAKYIMVLLKCHFEPIWLKDLKDPAVFVIGGFDENVPRLIEAFSRGAF